MDYKDLLAQRGLQMTPAEVKLVGVLLANPTLAPYYTAARLAEEADVNPASAIRFVKRLGFKGYAQFREALIAETLQTSEPAKRMTKRLEKSDSNEILPKLIEDEVSSLGKILDSVRQEQIDLVAHALTEAHCVYIFAQGNATVLQDMLDRRLRRAGLMTAVLSGDSREIAERLLAIQPSDVLFAFAFHSDPPGLAISVREFKKADAKTIIISDSKRHLDPYKPTIKLVASRGEESEFQSLTVPMAICNAIILTLAKTDGGKTLKSLDRLTTIIHQKDSAKGSSE